MYVGPLNLISASAAYAVRALSDGWLGQNIFRLRRDSDDAEMDFAADAVTGEAPVAAISTWLDGAGGFFVAWYDQSGNSKNLVQSVSSAQPAYEEDLINARPCVSCDGSNDCLGAESNLTLNGTNTIFSVHARSESSAGTIAGFELEGGSYWAFNTFTGPTGNVKVDVYQEGSPAKESGGTFTPASEPGDTAHLVDAKWEFGTRSLKVDGQEASLSGSNDSGSNPGDISGPLSYGVFKVGAEGGFVLVRGCELIICNSLIGETARDDVRENIANFYGI